MLTYHQTATDCKQFHLNLTIIGSTRVSLFSLRQQRQGAQTSANLARSVPNSGYQSRPEQITVLIFWSQTLENRFAWLQQQLCHSEQ